MAGELWYPIYDDATKDVLSGGFYVDPESVDPGAENTLGDGQSGGIPNPLKDEETGAALYTYNTETNLVEPKA